MKIIDLLNKIANGEEVPKKIKCNETIYEKWDYNNKYYDIESNTREKDILSEHLASESFYNDEVEILEEEKKIPEKLETLTYKNRNTISIWNEHRDKINEIIDCLDYLKSKGE